MHVPFHVKHLPCILILARLPPSLQAHSQLLSAAAAPPPPTRCFPSPRYSLPLSPPRQEYTPPTCLPTPTPPSPSLAPLPTKGFMHCSHVSQPSLPLSPVQALVQTSTQIATTRKAVAAAQTAQQRKATPRSATQSGHERTSTKTPSACISATGGAWTPRTSSLRRLAGGAVTRRLRRRQGVHRWFCISSCSRSKSSSMVSSTISSTVSARVRT